MDFAAAHVRFRDALARHLDVPNVAVSDFETPGHGGMSHETLLCDARFASRDGEGQLSLVVRIEPGGDALFPDVSLERQSRVMRAVAESGAIPVPRVLFADPDPSVFGRPYFVMERVAGQIPSDNPPYQIQGWLKDASAAEQAQVQADAMETMGRLHRLDPEDLDVSFLLRPAFGAPGLDEDFGYWRHYLAWASQDEPLPLLDAAFAWCVEHRPSEGPPASLNWGDARLGNLIFGPSFRLACVLDWEMAFLGPPEADIGWFLFLHETALIWLDDLPGFRDRDASLAIYQSALGRELHDLSFYMAWAGFKAAAIRARMVDRDATRDAARGVSDNRSQREDNPVITSLRRLIALPDAG
jgi:aminoglycoside phosphotransferase (APT) family kinase protein